MKNFPLGLLLTVICFAATGFNTPTEAQIFNSDVVVQSTNPDFILDDTDGESWAIEADEPVANAFSISKGGGATSVFVIENGAVANNLYLANSNVGIGTSNPIGDLNIYDVNGSGTAGIRMQVNSSTATGWDILADASFYRIGPSGGAIFLTVERDGDVNFSNGFFYSRNVSSVGIGTNLPDTKLHIRGFSEDAAIVVEELNGFALRRTMLELTNNGSPQLLFNDIKTATTWELNPNPNGNFTINSVGLGGGQEFTLTGSNGNLKISGQLRAKDFIVTSARDSKENFRDIDPLKILQLVVELPVREWNFKENSTTRHLGPVAEDFKNAFGLGGEETRISLIDSSGVALAAVKGLKQIHDTDLSLQSQEIADLRAEKDAEIAALKNELAELRAMVNELAISQNN